MWVRLGHLAPGCRGPDSPRASFGPLVGKAGIQGGWLQGLVVQELASGHWWMVLVPDMVGCRVWGVPPKLVSACLGVGPGQLAEGSKVSWSWCWPAGGQGQGTGVSEAWCPPAGGQAGSLCSRLWGCGGPGLAPALWTTGLAGAHLRVGDAGSLGLPLQGWGSRNQCKSTDEQS